MALRLRGKTLQRAGEFGEADFHVGGAALGFLTLLPPAGLGAEGEDHRKQQQDEGERRCSEQGVEKRDGMAGDDEHGRGQVHRLLISLIRVLFYSGVCLLTVMPAKAGTQLWWITRLQQEAGPPPPRG